MTMTAYQPPDDPRPTGRLAATLTAVFRGVWAVVSLLAGAADALVSAVLGTPRMGPIGRRVGREIADEYRRGYHDAIDLDEDDVIDPDDHHDAHDPEGVA